VDPCGLQACFDFQGGGRGGLVASEYCFYCDLLDCVELAYLCCACFTAVLFQLVPDNGCVVYAWGNDCLE
jgi:hypothetical protein